MGAKKVASMTNSVNQQNLKIRNAKGKGQRDSMWKKETQESVNTS
jgi:hypothetical protein